MKFIKTYEGFHNNETSKFSLNEKMGIKLSKVKSVIPNQYLVKTSKKEEKLKTDRKKSKVITGRINNLYQQIDEELRNLKWEEIYLEPTSRFFYIVLPKRIKNKIDKLSNYYEVLDDKNLIVPKDKIKQLYEDYKNYIKDDYIYAYVDVPRNRTHFPKGLPKSILGYDIGIKIYRNILDKLGFIQSEKNASSSVQSIYRRMIESPEVNAVIYLDLILLIDKNLNKEEKINILTESIYERYKMKPNRRLVLDKTIVLDSALKREIGEKNILKMIDELFIYSKNYDEVPFAEIGYNPK
jgi:hypothetical protein